MLWVMELVQMSTNNMEIMVINNMMGEKNVDCKVRALW